jgi:N-formylglutamate deformylase
VSRVQPADRPVPLVFDSPHSGTGYPSDFRSVLPIETLRHGEDRFVDELFALAPQHGIALIAARFARSYIDPNRDVCDIDPSMLDDEWPVPLRPGSASRLGVGLIWRRVEPDHEMYDRLLGVAEVQARIRRCWQPYQDTLEAALDALHAQHGQVWHLNCHSMRSVGTASSPDPGAKRPDVVLGDLDGSSCAPAFTDTLAACMRRLGYSVALNDPYRGAELVRRHGRPQQGRHSLQIELNRALYMDEQTLERTAGFERLRHDLGVAASALADHVRHALTGARSSG